MHQAAARFRPVITGTFQTPVAFDGHVSAHRNGPMPRLEPHPPSCRRPILHLRKRHAEQRRLGRASC